MLLYSTNTLLTAGHRQSRLSQRGCRCHDAAVARSGRCAPRCHGNRQLVPAHLSCAGSFALSLTRWQWSFLRDTYKKRLSLGRDCQQDFFMFISVAAAMNNNNNNNNKKKNKKRTRGTSRRRSRSRRAGSRRKRRKRWRRRKRTIRRSRSR